MIRFHDSPSDYYETAQGRHDAELIAALAHYEVDGSSRQYLTTPQFGQDHRSWRRALIREAVARGLIVDPCDAP